MFWTTIRDNYAYFDKKQTDWDRVKEIYAPLADTVTTRRSLVLLLERVFYELYDHHASLNTNTAESQKLVPSGTDLWAVFQQNKATLTDVKPGSAAQKAGLHAGMIVLQFNGEPVREAMRPFLARSLKHPDVEADNYALRTLLAGTHTGHRQLLLLDGADTIRYRDEASDEHSKEPFIESRILAGNIGYIRINNHLGDNGMIPVFDSILTSFMHTRALILDMRQTPSGGNTTVARAIMGRFIQKEGFYQKHELTEEEKESGIKRSWVEIVSPRGPMYAQPLAVLCSHWTGSVGEGIVIGFDALQRAKIIGTGMAGLNGAVYSFSLPYSGIGFNFPAEKIFRIDGDPRENFHPAIEVDLRRQRPGQDLALDRAIAYLRKLK